LPVFPIPNSALDVGILGTLVTTAKQQHDHIAGQGVIHAIASALVDSLNTLISADIASMLFGLFWSPITNEHIQLFLAGVVSEGMGPCYILTILYQQRFS
jgi:hypothetical protein